MSETVSVILCSYNRAEHLEKTLRSLREVRVPEEWTTELILVDNASTDATPKVMGGFTHPQMNVRVLREEKQGVCHARNRGIAEAKGRVLLFTDDDVRFPFNWIARMAAPILNDEADVIAGGVELAEEIQQQWMTPWHRQLLASTEGIDPNRPERIVGANMAFSRKIFDHIPGFDQELGPGQLGLGGETLLYLQVREAGFRIGTAFDVVVNHHPDPSRLTRDAWDAAAKKSGRAGAYRSYHWRHRQYSLPALLAGWVYYSIRAWWKKAMGQFYGEAPMSVEELHLRRKKYRVRQHLRECGRVPKYEKHGLVKKAT